MSLAPDVETIEQILKKYPTDKRYLIEILHDIQLRFRHLPRVALEKVAEYLSVPKAQVMSVATFYKAFSFTPKGETVIRICMGTACHVRGAAIIKEEAEKRLGIKAGETTKDLKYSLEVVNCVGACAMAPVVIINDVYHGKFTPKKFDEVLEQRS